MSYITKKDVLEFCDKETHGLEIIQDCHNGGLLGDTKVLNNQGDYRQGSKHDPAGYSDGDLVQLYHRY